MIIISEYILVQQENGLFLVKNTGKPPTCPLCGGKLAYRDSRKRICKGEGGVTAHLVIRRLRCTACNVIHNELPDCLVPHKHYATDVISGVLDGVITSEDDDAEDFPCQETMQRWVVWFQNILDSLNRDNSNPNIASEFRNKYQNWLELLIYYAPGLFCGNTKRSV